MIESVVSPISIPVKEKLLSAHIKKGAFLVHIATEMPLAFDEEGVLSFLRPLLYMQRLGSRNNVMIAYTNDRRAMADGLLAWQLFGGIGLPIIKDIETTLKSIDDMLEIPLGGLNVEKRAMQLATKLPFDELDICDEWKLEEVLLYALTMNSLPSAETKKPFFNLSDIDRDVLLEKQRNNHEK